jgi:hypothetical protein
MSALTLDDLEQEKTRLIAKLAAPHPGEYSTSIGAKIQLLEELIERLTPKPTVRRYFVLYGVTWQPRFDGDDAPMDMEHRLTFTDERITDHEMVEIGSLEGVHRTIENIL